MRLQDYQILKTRIYECLVLLFYAWAAFFSFLDTTTVSFVWKSEILNPVRLVLFAAVCISLFLRKDWTWQRVLFAIIVLLGFGGSYLTFHRRFLLDTALLIIGAGMIDFKKVLKVYLGAGIAGMVLSISLAAIGITENLVFVQPLRSMRQVRYAFGSLYVTDFSAHLLFLTGAFLLLMKERRRITGLLILAEAAFVFWFCGAFTAVLCFGLMTGVYYISDHIAADKTAHGKKLLSALIAVPSLLAGLMIVLSYNFDPKIKWMAVLDRAMHARLKYGKMGFTRYAVRLFGQYVEMNGNGGEGVQASKGKYFFLDCSYVNILLCLGIMALIAVILIMTINCFRAWETENWLLLGVLIIVCIDSIMEHHLAEIAYNPFLLMPLADLSWMKEKRV